MTDLIIGQVVVPILQELSWTDQIAWMVTSWTKQIQTGDKEFKDLTIPVAKYVTVEGCTDIAANLKAVMTDRNYDSLIMIQSESDMSSEIASNIAGRRAINIEQDFSINVWLNDAHGAAHIAESEILKAFYRATFKNQAVNWYNGDNTDAAYDLYINKLRITYVRTIDGNPFKDFSFANDQAQFHNRYSCFGMVFKMTGLIFPNCGPAYPELERDNCDVHEYYVIDENDNRLSDGTNKIIYQQSILQ